MDNEARLWQTLEQTTLQEAAILVPCYRAGDEDYIILTKRTEAVLHHKGQICFPGGARDAADESLWKTALREAHEEIGLEPSQATLIKELKSQFTPTGFKVTPFVASIQSPSPWKTNPVEIAEIFSVPVSHLRNPENVHFLKRSYNDIEFMEPHFIYLTHDIWGMTGRVICELIEMVQEIHSKGDQNP